MCVGRLSKSRTKECVLEASVLLVRKGMCVGSGTTIATNVLEGELRSVLSVLEAETGR